MDERYDITAETPDGELSLLKVVKPRKPKQAA